VPGQSRLEKPTILCRRGYPLEKTLFFVRMAFYVRVRTFLSFLPDRPGVMGFLQVKAVHFYLNAKVQLPVFG
jgi:hypothetical protein